jgi:hypothetical protein
MTPMFAKLKAQHDELELLIKTKMEEKELFSEQYSKASKQIKMFQEMIELIYQGSVDARCKWIWEKGSIKGFSYEPSFNDLEEITKIKAAISQEEVNLSKFSGAGKTCKSEIKILEAKLPYALLGIEVKHFGSSTDDETTSNNFGNLFYNYEIDINSYDKNGNLTHSSHTIKFLPKDENSHSNFIEWREVRKVKQPDGSFKNKEIPIEKDPQWSYIIKTFLKPKI